MRSFFSDCGIVAVFCSVLHEGWISIFSFAWEMSLKQSAKKVLSVCITLWPALLSLQAYEPVLGLIFSQFVSCYHMEYFVSLCLRSNFSILVAFHF